MQKMVISLVRESYIYQSLTMKGRDQHKHQFIYNISDNLARKNDKLNALSVFDLTC